MSDEGSDLSTTLLLFLLGAAAGAILVALTTPKSGPDLRADIKGLAGKIKRKAQEAGMALCPVCGGEDEAGKVDEEVGS